MQAWSAKFTVLKGAVLKIFFIFTISFHLVASLNGLTSYFFSFSSGIRLNCNQHVVCCKEVIFTEDDCLRLIFLLKSL